MKLFFVLLIFSLGCFAEGNRPVSLYRTQAEVIHPRSVELQFFTSYFMTASTYNTEGVGTAVDVGNSFSILDGGGELKYCFKAPFEIRVGVNGRMVNSTDGSTSLSAQGIESYWVGAKYAFRQGKSFIYALDFKFRQTAYSNTFFVSAPSTYDDIELGDAGHEMSFGLNLAYYRSKGNSFSGSAYYRLPPNDLSAEIVYNIEASWALRNYALFLGADGIYSLQGSQYSDNPSSRPAMSTGISQQFNSVNRSLLGPYVGLNIAYTSFRFSLKGAYVMSGVSTDGGYRFLGSLTWSGKPRKGKHKEKIHTFKEYEIEASVIKVSPRGKFVKIDQGLAHDVEKGMIFDIYKSDYFGGNALLATGRVYEVGATWAIIKITKKFKNVELKAGLYARGI